MAHMADAILVIFLMLVVIWAIGKIIDNQKDGGCSGCPYSGSCRKGSCRKGNDHS